MITTEEYRQLVDDYYTDEILLQKRIEYLTAFCKNIAKEELEKYVREQSDTKS